jgi:soluble lytic murein transglycosylase-like protein
MKYLLFMLVSFGVQANYDPIISAAAAKYDVPFSLIKAVIEKESSFRKNVCSKKGACGLMQLMPSKAKEYGVKNRFNAAQNIDGGTHLLHDLFEQFGDLDLVLAAYNAGENIVAKRGVPSYTRSFIRDVKQFARAYEPMCYAEK